MNKYHAPALDKGLDILEYLSSEAKPQSQSEIAQGIQKSPNEIYRMLVCLEQRGYLMKEANSGNYSLSLKLFHISHRHSPIEELIKYSKPAMERLSRDTQQSCHLGVLYNGQLLIVSQNRSPGLVSLSIEEGGLFPLVKTTSGRVVLAFLSDEQREFQLDQNKEFLELSTKEKKSFLSYLEGIRERGYEIKESEITLGVTDLAVPIGSMKSGVFGVLAISCLTSISQSNHSFEVMIPQLVSAAEQINHSLGFMTSQFPIER
ncbi:IclR family transcriptional regulator [Dyadobacter jejuensis]|nr:IclR family transcriptional regulator [Dyadobacter jejuensis]